MSIYHTSTRLVSASRIRKTSQKWSLAKEVPGLPDNIRYSLYCTLPRCEACRHQLGQREIGSYQNRPYYGKEVRRRARFRVLRALIANNKSPLSLRLLSRTVLQHPVKRVSKTEGRISIPSQNHKKLQCGCKKFPQFYLQ